MPAPVATPRVQPTGKHLDDGKGTKFTLEVDPDILFWEVTVKPPSIDVGDPIDVKTMFTNKWRPKAPRKTVESGSITLKVRYAPEVYPLIVAAAGTETTGTVAFENGGTLALFCFLQTFEPDELGEGDEATGTVTICPTNRDPTDGTEQAPVYTPPPP